MLNVHYWCSLIALVELLVIANVGEAGDGDDDKSVVNDLCSPVLPASSKLAGVSLVEEGSTDMIPGVDLPTIVDVVFEPTRVDMGGPHADPPQVNALFDDAVFDTALDDDLKRVM
jgi:hypothetical protein